MGEKELLKIGQNIEMIRRSKGFTLESIASQIGHTPQWLSNIEKNRRSIVSTDLYKISQILGVDLKYFFKQDLNITFNNSKVNSDLIFRKRREEI